MRRKAIFFLILLVTSSFSLFLGEIPVAEGAGENWLDWYGYRKSHTITGTTSALTDYPVQTVVYYRDGVDSGADVYLDGKVRPDFGDVNFTDSDGDTTIDFWMEELNTILGEKFIDADGIATLATYSNAIAPQAIHYEGTHNLTYIVYQDQGFDPNIITFNHTSGNFSSPVQIANSPIADNHGAPCIVIDDAGFIHVFYGCHTSALKHAKSDNAENITAWTVQADADNAATYPNVQKTSNGTIFLRYRGTGTLTMCYRKSVDNCASWEAEVIFGSFGAGYAPYVGQMQIGSDDSIHVIWTLLDVGAGTRENVYYTYSTDYGATWKGKNGVDCGAQISKAEADTNCMVYDSTGDPKVGSLTGHYNDLRLDASDEPYIVYIHGKAGNEYQFSFASWNTTSNLWDKFNVTTGGIGGLRVGQSLDYVSSSDVNIYKADTEAETLELWKSIDDGETWSLDQTLASIQECVSPKRVHDYTDDLKMIWTIGDSTPSDVYAYGDAMDEEAYAEFWYEVPSISATPGTETIYLYYGNSSLTYPSLATDLAHGEATFDFFDNFDDGVLDGAKWQSAGVSETGGNLVVPLGGFYAATKVWKETDEFAIRSKLQTGGNRRFNLGFSKTLNPVATEFALTQGIDGVVRIYMDNGGVPSVPKNYGVIAVSTWVDNELALVTASNKIIASIDATTDSDTDAAACPDEDMYGVIASWGSSSATLYATFILIRKYHDPEPTNTAWGSEESYSANTAPVLSGYTISNWDGEALYTNGEFSNWWLQATDADGGSDITTFECAFLLGSEWCNFTFTSSTGLWVKDTDCPITIQSDGQSAIGTTKNALGILAIEDWATPTENVVVYGRVTDASSATSGWGTLPGVGFSVREPESSGEDGGYRDPGDDEDDEVDEEPIPECWMTNTDNLNAMSVDELRILADILGLTYTEDTTKAELVEAIYNEATRLCDEGETPFSGCLMDAEEKLAKLEYLMGLSVQELRSECNSLGISYMLWRDPEPYIVLIFTVGYQCTVPDEFYEDGFDPEDWDEDGTKNWDDPDMFDPKRKAIEARIDDLDLEMSLPWIKTNGYMLIILLLVFAFFYSQVKKKDQPGSRGESLIRPRQGGYVPGERRK